MPLIVCPECGHQISDRAPLCPHCGFPSVSQSIIRPPEPPIRAELVPQSSALSLSPLQEIAYRQKLLLYALLINFLSQLPMYCCFQSHSLVPLGLAGFVANAALGIWCLYRLGSALQLSPPVIAFFAVGLFFPCICLGVIYVFTQRASVALRQAGVRVGLMGANLAKVP